MIIIKVLINNLLRKQTCNNLHGNKINKRKRKNAEGKRPKKIFVTIKETSINKN